MISRGVRSISTAAASVPVATATTSWPAVSSSRCSSALLLGSGSASRITPIYVVTPIDARKGAPKSVAVARRHRRWHRQLSQHPLVGCDLCPGKRFQSLATPRDQVEQLAILAKAFLLVRQRGVQDVR